MIRNTLGALIILMLLTGCQNETPATSEKEHPMKDGFYSRLKHETDLETPEEETGLGKISWNKEEHDFGQIIEGDVVSHTFFFTNNGEGPLSILKTESRCGCTVANYSKEPVMPGETGEMSVVFDSRERLEDQSKAVIVHCNGTPRKTALVVRAFVKPKSN